MKKTVSPFNRLSGSSWKQPFPDVKKDRDGNTVPFITYVPNIRDRSKYMPHDGGGMRAIVDAEMAKEVRALSETEDSMTIYTPEGSVVDEA